MLSYFSVHYSLFIIPILDILLIDALTQFVYNKVDSIDEKASSGRFADLRYTR